MRKAAAALRPRDGARRVRRMLRGAPTSGWATPGSTPAGVGERAASGALEPLPSQTARVCPEAAINAAPVTADRRAFGRGTDTVRVCRRKGARARIREVLDPDPTAAKRRRASYASTTFWRAARGRSDPTQQALVRAWRDSSRAASRSEPRAALRLGAGHGRAAPDHPRRNALDPPHHPLGPKPRHHLWPPSCSRPTCSFLLAPVITDETWGVLQAPRKARAGARSCSRGPWPARRSSRTLRGTRSPTSTRVLQPAHVRQIEARSPWGTPFVCNLPLREAPRASGLKTRSCRYPELLVKATGYSVFGRDLGGREGYNCGCLLHRRRG